MTAQPDGTGNGFTAARLREAAGPPGDWTDPGADEAAPGVWRIPLPLPLDGLRAVNVYAITDGSGLVLVDGGWALAESQEELARALDRIGYGLGDISQFLVTHLHRDHYTQAVAIRRRFGARVAVGIGERPWLRQLQNRAATGSWSNRIGELNRHHEQRFQIVADAVGDGGSTAFEVAGRLTWTRRQRRLAELDVFNQMMAIIETAAHLDVLTDQGELKSAPAAVTRYFPR